MGRGKDYRIANCKVWECYNCDNTATHMVSGHYVCNDPVCVEACKKAMKPEEEEPDGR